MESRLILSQRISVRARVVPPKFLCGLLAQRSERQVVNLRVQGSNPWRPSMTVLLGTLHTVNDALVFGYTETSS